MITNIDVVNNKIHFFCGVCKADKIFDLPDFTPKILENGEYENLLITCPEGCMHFVNMNLPQDEFDISDEIEYPEWNARELAKSIADHKIRKKELKSVVRIKKKDREKEPKDFKKNREKGK